MHTYVTTRCCWCDAEAVADIHSDGWTDEACATHVALHVDRDVTWWLS